MTTGKGKRVKVIHNDFERQLGYLFYFRIPHEEFFSARIYVRHRTSNCLLEYITIYTNTNIYLSGTR
jgi:hypothetical protein